MIQVVGALVSSQTWGQNASILHDSFDKAQGQFEMSFQSEALQKKSGAAEPVIKSFPVPTKTLCTSPWLLPCGPQHNTSHCNEMETDNFAGKDATLNEK